MPAKGTKIRRKRKNDEGGTRALSVLSDAEKFQVLTEYAKGSPIIDISITFDVYSREISTFITTQLQSLNSTREVNKLVQGNSLGNLAKALPTPEEMSKDFLDKEVPEKCLEYAYYMGMTGDNKYSLKASGLDKSILAKGTRSTSARAYALRARGMYLRSLPSVQLEIDRVRKSELKISNVDKPYLVSELIEQLNQAKEIAIDDPTARRHTISLLKMIGDTIPGAFSQTIKVEEVNPEDSLQALIEMAEADLTSTYTIEDIDDEEGSTVS